MDNGEARCIAFGGLRVDDAIEDALLTVVGPGAIAAAVAAEKEANQRGSSARSTQRDLERRAMPPIVPSGNTTPADPANRLVAGNWRRAGTRRSRAWRRSKAKIVAHEAAKVVPSPIRHRSPLSCGPQDRLDRPLD